jgi:Fibronectin type III domain
VGSSSTVSPAVSVGATVLSRIFNDRRPGVSYAYYVRAVNSVGDGTNSGYTAPVLVNGPTTTAAPLPAAPTNPALAFIGNGQLRVSWTPPTASPAPISFYRITTTPSLGTFTVNASTLQITINGARAGVAYLAKIASVTPAGLVGTFAISNPANVPVPVTVPLPPTSARPTVPPLPPQGKPLPVQPPTPPGKPKPCISKPWPKSVYGRPATFTTGAPQGVYVWHDGKYFQVRVYNPGPGRVVFTGRITANTKVTFWAHGADRGDSLRRGRSSATFAFSSDYDIDGIRISASCATALTFDLKVNGVPVAPQFIFVGPATTAGGSVFSLVR